ncbi:MAG: tRNA (adenosine(37)-N6)-threonylcarbamoyltransferase complex ATPase subunit type 1 TsaE, partial [Deltaproteobacteria bacterium]|nr:tRNA (adenosine(37)-N6)-threonylcarbamoyltransferase complex ATPase subunit type 1 TsaE [Deltaproteobacteria bacterium]
CIGRIVLPGDVICLNGNLGAGKTTLTQLIARGMDIPANCYVTSPSYAILHEYEGRIPLYHMDFYRLHDSGEIIDLGFEEYFYLDGVTVIEWSERAENILPAERIEITIISNQDETRTVRFNSTDDAIAGRFEKMLVEILKIVKP